MEDELRFYNVMQKLLMKYAEIRNILSEVLTIPFPEEVNSKSIATILGSLLPENKLLKKLEIALNILLKKLRIPENKPFSEDELTSEDSTEAEFKKNAS